MLSKQTIQLPSALWIIGKDVALLGHPLRRPLRSFFTTPLVPLELRMVHCHLKRLHLGEVDAKRLEVILQLLQNQRPLVFIQADEKYFRTCTRSHRTLALEHVNDIAKHLDISHCKFLPLFCLHFMQLQVPPMTSIQPCFKDVGLHILHFDGELLHHLGRQVDQQSRRFSQGVYFLFVHLLATSARLLMIADDALEGEGSGRLTHTAQLLPWLVWRFVPVCWQDFFGGQAVVWQSTSFPTPLAHMSFQILDQRTGKQRHDIPQGIGLCTHQPCALGNKGVESRNHGCAVLIPFLLELPQGMKPCNEVGRFADAITDAQQEVLKDLAFHTGQLNMEHIHSGTWLFQSPEGLQQGICLTMVPEHMQQCQGGGSTKHALHIPQTEGCNWHTHGLTCPWACHH